ncbi:MAG: hypothetical protein NTV52_18325 [Acidobacteria bacterium]|nr:hypothetical protein [Acidobacteriota bacterium]
MKFLPALFCAMSLWAADPAVREVKAVYLLPMTSGLDQFLASRLTSEGVVQVVTDPLKADAVLTDKVGEALERKMHELYDPKPEPPKPDPAAEAKKDEKTKEKESKDAAKAAEATKMARAGQSSWGRGRGSIFLVQRSTGNVIWSTEGQPKDSSPPQVRKTAAKITAQLKKDRTVAPAK